MFAAEYQPAQPSRRRSPRAPVSLQGEWDNGGLDKALCKVLDLSMHGCRLQTYSELERGSTIWLTLPGIPGMAARVVWTQDFVAGCLFERMLNRKLFQHMAKRYGIGA